MKEKTISTQDLDRNMKYPEQKINNCNSNYTLQPPLGGILQVSYPGLSSAAPTQISKHTTKCIKFLHPSSNNLSLATRGGRLSATETSSVPETAAATEEPPSIDFAFVGSRLLPDGTPDISIRSACGGQKLRDIMLDCNIDLYGPYAKPLLNCAGGGTCGTCLVEVVEGKELLTPRTDIEKEQLKKKPKTWRLACQTTVGKQDSTGQVAIQQLPEWKAHDGSSRMRYVLSIGKTDCNMGYLCNQRW